MRAWGLAIQCADPAVYSPVLTGVMTPDGVDADAVRKLIYERFDMSLGTGLGKMKGRMFRIGHLGDCNDLTLLATLAGCEMGLKLAGVRSPAAACRRRWRWLSGRWRQWLPEAARKIRMSQCRMRRHPGESARCSIRGRDRHGERWLGEA